MLLRRARMLVGQEAEDVVQDAFLRAWKKAPDRPGAFPLWITTIVIHVALDRVKRRRPVLLFSMLPPGGSSNGRWENRLKAPSETSLWKRLARKDLVTVVQHAMEDALNDIERKALALKINGETHETIAASLGMPIQDIQSILRKSLYILRSLLDAQQISPIS